MPLPLPAAAAVPAAGVAAAAEAAVLADGAGVDGKGASSSSHLLLSEDGPLLCSHLFQEIGNIQLHISRLSGI